MRDYRFEYKIFDALTEEVIVSGSTYVLPHSVHEDGGCESVELELFSGLRFFKNKGFPLHESKYEPTFDEIWP